MRVWQADRAIAGRDSKLRQPRVRPVAFVRARPRFCLHGARPRCLVGPITAEMERGRLPYDRPESESTASGSTWVRIQRRVRQDYGDGAAVCRCSIRLTLQVLSPRQDFRRRVPSTGVDRRFGLRETPGDPTGGRHLPAKEPHPIRAGEGRHAVLHQTWRVWVRRTSWRSSLWRSVTVLQNSTLPFERTPVFSLPTSLVAAEGCARSSACRLGRHLPRHTAHRAVAHDHDGRQPARLRSGLGSIAAHIGELCLIEEWPHRAPGWQRVRIDGRRPKNGALPGRAGRRRV